MDIIIILFMVFVLVFMVFMVFVFGFAVAAILPNVKAPIQRSEKESMLDSFKSGKSIIIFDKDGFMVPISKEMGWTLDESEKNFCKDRYNIEIDNLDWSKK